MSHQPTWWKLISVFRRLSDIGRRIFPYQYSKSMKIKELPDATNAVLLNVFFNLFLLIYKSLSSWYFAMCLCPLPRVSLKPLSCIHQEHQGVVERNILWRQDAARKVPIDQNCINIYNLKRALLHSHESKCLSS